MRTQGRILRTLGSIASVALLVVLTGAVPFQATQLALSYWPLDEATGTTAVDVISAQNGNWMGNPTVLATPLPPLTTNNLNSHALTFDGTGNQYVEVPNTTVLENVQEASYSLSAWCRPADVPPGTGATFNASYAVIIKAGYHEGICYQNNQTFSFQHWGTGNVWAGCGSPSFPPGSWYHVAAVWDRVANQVRLYVNGTMTGSAAATLDNRDYAQNPWRIGIAYQGTGNYTWPMKGDIDDVRIYNYALTANQVQVLSNGTPTPTGLTATSALGQVSLSWTAPPQAVTYTYSVYSSTVPNPANWGAPIATGLTTTNYTDTAGTPNVLTYYTVTATSCATSGYCPPASGTNFTPISANPPTGLQTNENGAQATFDLVFNLPLPAGSSVTITLTSSRPLEGQVSASGVPMAGTIVYGPVNGPVAAGSTIPITVTGIDDFFADGPQAYTITVTTSSGNAMFNNLSIPPIGCINNDNDTPGITFSRTSGITTSEPGGADSFAVVLNTQPTNTVTMSLTSSNTAEGTVLPAQLQFTTTGGQAYSPATGIGGWNVPHLVTVTGVDDTVLDFTVPYTIVTGNLVSTDPNYNTMAVTDVSCVNLDDEVPPELTHVWGGGGCGFLGLEMLLPLALAGLLRRRRSS